MGPWVFSPFHPLSFRLCAVCESSTGRTLYSSPAYPLASLPPGVRLSFDVQLRRTPSNCIGVFFFLAVCGCLRRESFFPWFCYEPRWVLWFLPGLHPFWFSLRLCMRILLGLPFVDPMPTHRLTSRRDRFVLWAFQSNTEPLRRQFFFVCVGYWNLNSCHLPTRFRS